MYVNKERQKIRQGTWLIILAVVLFSAGVSTIFAPVLLQDIELNHDADEYAELIEQYRTGHKVDDLENRVAEPTEEDDVTVAPATQAATTHASITDMDFAALQAINDDFVAWIRVPGTKVNYPVVLTDNVDYYLNHTFTGKESKIGTLFSLGKTDYRTPGKNIAVYGHNIRGSGQNMFQPLIAYKKKSFYSSRDTIHFDTLYHTGTYKVFAVVNMRSGEWDPSRSDFTTANDFLDYVNRAKSLSLYETGVEVKASDQILTLITCDRSYDADGRLVLMAVKQ